MRNTNKIGIFLATIAVIAGCQMGNSEDATQAVSASPSPTLNFMEISSNSVSGSIGITAEDVLPNGLPE